MIYFTSDFHLHHDSIVDYCNRPCNKGEEHYQWLMDHLQVLKEGDTLYFLGDLMFKATPERIITFFEYLESKGVTLYIAIGNHDEQFINMLYEVYRKVFNKAGPKYIQHYFSLRNKDISIPFPVLVMSHYPMASWNNSHRGSVMLHGHTHGNSPKHKNRFDVGIDVEHKLYSLDDILSMWIPPSQEKY